MNRIEKNEAIQELTDKLSTAQYFYLTNSDGLTVEQVGNFRRICYREGLEFRVVKNTLLKKAMEANGAAYDELHEILHGPTSVIFTQTGNLPAKILADFNKTAKKKITLKGAYIDTAIYIGADQLDSLKRVKSKNELIADLVFTLQSPVRTVLGQLQSGGAILAGILKTLEEKEA